MSRSSRHMLAADEYRKLIQNTETHTVEDLWELRIQKLLIWFPQKKDRFSLLYKTALTLKQKEGTAALISRLYKFLRGERQGLSSSLAEVRKQHPHLTSKELYTQWIRLNEPDQSVLDAQKEIELDFVHRPLITVLLYLRPDGSDRLHQTVNSILSQTYSNWELFLIGDCSTEAFKYNAVKKIAQRDKRIKLRFQNKETSLSKGCNEYLKKAAGEYITVIEQNDTLALNAFYENILLINQHPDADMIYSDEDKLQSRNLRSEPHFKPDWSPEFFYSSMYTGNLSIYRKSLVKEVGGFRSAFDRIQNQELALRLTEKTDKIYHIHKILYHSHSRVDENCPDINLEELKIQAISEHFQGKNEEVIVTHGLTRKLLRVKRILTSKPKVSIIVPSRDHCKLLKDCIESILKLSTYDNYEIVIVDNNSSEPETLEYFDKIKQESKIRILKYLEHFNFSAINNFAAREAHGEILIFLNNDTKIISQEWIEAMLEHAVRPEVGAVGARLLYPDGMVQHAGVIIGIGGVAAHSHRCFPADHPGYFNRAKAIQNVSAVTGACMMVRKDVFNALGGFNEKDLAVAYNDVDLCLRMRQQKLSVIYTPYAELYHHESASRGSDQIPENVSRFQSEAEYMLKYWKEALLFDPYYNPNLTLDREDFSIVV